MQRKSLFFLIIVLQLAVLGVGLLLVSAAPAIGAPGGPKAVATSQPTIPAGSTATPTLPGAQPTGAPTTPACEMTFNDVHTGDYFYESVRTLYCSGAVSGYSDNTFRPYNSTTRGQMAKIIVLATWLPIVTPARPSFSDVSAANAFYQYIETAAANNLVSGYADGTFRWYNNVTRGQLAKIVVSAQGWRLLTPATPTFVDVSASNPFYSYVETASAHGAISGYDTPNGTAFRWSSDATRGQIAKIIALSMSGGAH